MEIRDKLFAVCDLALIPVVGTLAAHTEGSTDLVPGCAGFPCCLHDVPTPTDQKVNELGIRLEGIYRGYVREFVEASLCYLPALLGLRVFQHRRPGHPSPEGFPALPQ